MTDLNKQREAFEVAYSEGRKIFPSTLKKYADGTYYNGDVRAAWKWWQAGKAQAVPEWISVDDKWPEYGQLILVVISGQTQTRVFFRDGSDCSKDWIEPVNGDDCHNTICWEKVTHWMPLPKASSKSGAEG